MNIALILSGGTGTRLGSNIPKQYLEVEGRPVISYALERLSIHEKIDAIWIVADMVWREQILKWISQYDPGRKFKGFSDPGENRQLSILNGLEGMKEAVQDSDLVLIHDAARPLIAWKLITDCLEAVQEYDGVLPVLPMKDTVYASTDGKRISSLLDRNCIFAGQAPEVFRFGKYYRANRQLLPEAILKVNGSTEPAVMAGMNIIMIQGDENNFKITTQADLKRFQEIAGGF